MSKKKYPTVVTEPELSIAYISKWADKLLNSFEAISVSQSYVDELNHAEEESMDDKSFGLVVTWGLINKHRHKIRDELKALIIGSQNIEEAIRSSDLKLDSTDGEFRVVDGKLCLVDPSSGCVVEFDEVE